MHHVCQQAVSIVFACITLPTLLGALKSVQACTWYAAMLTDCKGNSVSAEELGRAVQKQVWAAYYFAAVASEPAEIRTAALAADDASSIKTCFRF